MGLSVKVTMRKCAPQIPPAYFADASAGSTVGFWSTALALGLHTYKRNQEILITGIVYHMFGICCKSILESCVVAIHRHPVHRVNKGTIRGVESGNHLTVPEVDTYVAVTVLEHNITWLRG